MDDSNKMVDAIEDGKIVNVSEEYAKREGLMVLRKPKQPFNPQEIAERNIKRKFENEKTFGIENLRKPLHWVKSQVINELVENFQWEIANARKRRNLTRKQLASSIGETENNIKMIENGLLPKNDFILINKIQDYLKINLRKDGRNFTNSARALLNEKEHSPEIFEDKKSVQDKEIEIIED